MTIPPETIAQLREKFLYQQRRELEVPYCSFKVINELIDAAERSLRYEAALQKILSTGDNGGNLVALKMFVIAEQALAEQQQKKGE